mmetsp:Transcript_86640/g.279799  ORF Transcript_86640/g.279799 Transcript_86640/m.279799 type:complete len:270 (+) Transcript_86640:1859-2668(+)
MDDRPGRRDLLPGEDGDGAPCLGVRGLGPPLASAPRGGACPGHRLRSTGRHWEYPPGPLLRMLLARCQLHRGAFERRASAQHQQLHALLCAEGAFARRRVPRELLRVHLLLAMFACGQANNSKWLRRAPRQWLGPPNRHHDAGVDPLGLVCDDGRATLLRALQEHRAVGELAAHVHLLDQTCDPADALPAGAAASCCTRHPARIGLPTERGALRRGLERGAGPRAAGARGAQRPAGSRQSQVRRRRRRSAEALRLGPLAGARLHERLQR